MEKRVAALEKKANLPDATPKQDGSPAPTSTEIQLAQLSTLLEQRGLSLPIPPGHLQLRVAGTYSAQFFRQGADLLRDIESLLEAQGRKLDSFESILDFGSGCGRILIPLTLRVPAQRVHGCDIDAEAIAWCRDNLRSCGGFRLNRALPPMEFADQSFDLVYGVSVFTHLPEHMQFQWLQELFRITKPGGYAVLTFHGEAHYGALRRFGRAKLDEHGFFYTNSNKGSTAGLPSFYQTAWHTHAYVREHWGAQYQVVDIVEAAIANHAAAVLRRPS